MGVRAKEDGKSQCRSVMGRIRAPTIAIPARKRADVHLVFHCERVWRIFVDGKANGGKTYRCVHPRLQALEFHPLEGCRKRCEKTPVAYRKGCIGKEVPEGQVPPVASDPLISWQIVGCKTRYHQQGQKHARGRRRGMANQASENGGGRRPASQRLCPPTFKKNLHS